MPYKEKPIIKKYHTIGAVANMFSVATSLIRFWESEFKSIRPKKNRKGNRQFTLKDIENVNDVYKLVKQQGYTLEGARQQLYLPRNLKQCPHCMGLGVVPLDGIEA